MTADTSVTLLAAAGKEKEACKCILCSLSVFRNTEWCKVAVHS
jgi:hypothetical protein